jgi:hypothetical protein
MTKRFVLATAAVIAAFAGIAGGPTEATADDSVPGLVGAPSVVVSPADGATNVDLKTKITATFSRPMAYYTITTLSFKILRPDGTQVPAMGSYDPTTNTATWTPTAPLDYSKQYTVRLEPTIIAADGLALSGPASSTFRTVGTGVETEIDSGGAGDKYFKGGASRSTSSVVSGTTDPAAYLEERYGLFTYTIPVSNGTYDVRLNFAETLWGASGRRVFGIDVLETPALNDISGLDIYAAVGANTALVKTISGVSATANQIRIKTVAYIDQPVISAIELVPVAPAVRYTSPAAGATDVQRWSNVKVTFSRAMDPTSLTSSTFTLIAQDGTPVSAAIAYDAGSRSATLTPYAKLAPETAYTVRLDESVRAADGMIFTSPVTWTFSTR